MRCSLVALALVLAFVLGSGALLNRGGREPRPSAANQRGDRTEVLGAAAPSESKAPAGSDTRPEIPGAETEPGSGASAEGESTAAFAPDTAPAVVPGVGDASDALAEPGGIPPDPVRHTNVVSTAGELGPAGDGSPRFDVLRVEPIGKVLIAGRSRPGTEIEVLMEGQVVGRAKADEEGVFIIAILEARVPLGSYGLELREAGAAGSGGPERQVTIAARLGTDGTPPSVEEKIAAARPRDAPGQIALDFQQVAPAQFGGITDLLEDVQLGLVQGPEGTPGNAGSDLVAGAPAAAQGRGTHSPHMASSPGQNPHPEGAAAPAPGTPHEVEVAGGGTPADGSATPGSNAEGGRAAVTPRPGAADGGERVASAAILKPKTTAPGDDPAEMDSQRADDLALGNAPEQDVTVLELPPSVLTGQRGEGAPPPDAAASPGSSAEPAVSVRPPFHDRQQQARRSEIHPSSGRVVATPETVVKPELPEGLADLQHAPVLRRLDAAPVDPQDAVAAGQAGTAATREGAGERPPLEGTEPGRAAAVRTGPAPLGPAARAAPDAGFTSEQSPLPAGDRAGQTGADPGPTIPEFGAAAGRDTARQFAPMPGSGDSVANGLILEQIRVVAARDSGQDAALSAELPPPAVVIIRPGDNLWRISRRNYGRGVRYQSIFAANGDQIRNPDLIYPGQVFLLPTRDRSWTAARNESGSPETQ